MTAAKVRGGAAGNMPLRMHDTLTHVRGVVQRQQPLGAVVAEQRLVPQVGALLREQNLRLAPRLPTVLRSDHLRESPPLKQREGFRGVLTTSALIICVERRIDSSAVLRQAKGGRGAKTLRHAWNFPFWEECMRRMVPFRGSQSHAGFCSDLSSFEIATSCCMETEQGRPREEKGGFGGRLRACGGQ